MTPLDTRDTAREALKPTGETQPVLREISDQIPPVFEVEADPYRALSDLRGCLFRAISKLEWIETPSPYTNKCLEQALADLNAGKLIAESLRPVTR